MLVQAFLAQPAIEAFDHGVIGGFSRSAQIHFDAVFLGPLVHYLADELAAVVGLDGCRLSPSAHNGL